MKYPDDFIDKVICGDCLEVMKQIPDNSVDLVITSPPYNVDADYDIYSDDMNYDEYMEWCGKWLSELKRIIKTDGRICINHYICYGRSNQHQSPLSDLKHIAVSKVGLKFNTIILWEEYTSSKRTAWGSFKSASAPYIQNPFEGVLVLYKDRWKKDNKGISTITADEFVKFVYGVWKITPSKSKEHPATFPEELPERCIKLLSYEDDIVLDPFNGIGNTTTIAKKLKRHYIGIDISQKYCDIAKKRLANIPNIRIDDW